MSLSRVGLLGLGTVGSAVYDQIQTNLWERFEVARASVRDRTKPRPPAIEALLCDAEYLVQADDVDVVVEVMGGVQPALSLIKLALTQGKRCLLYTSRCV